MNFSFQNELTFAPKLNSLSLKLAGVNRTSLLERTPKKKNTTLDSSYTFQPVLSNNSSKIVAKLKTGFWERQKLHAKRQQEKIDQGPSTIHPNLKRSKEQINEKDGRETRKLQNSISDQTCQQSQDSKKIYPHSKSIDAIALKEKRKQVKHEIDRLCSNFDKERLQAKIKCNSYITPSDMKTTETKLHRSLKNDEDETHVLSSRSKSLPSVSNEDIQMTINSATLEEELQTASSTSVLSQQSPKQSLSKHINLSEDNSNDEECVKQENNTNQQTKIFKDNQHSRSLTFPLQLTSKARKDKMDLEHQKLIKVKKVASQAIKSKKVFVCNGPYHTLRAALRRRGWIEKYFKGDPTSCMIIKDDKKEEDNHAKNQQMETKDTEFCSTEDNVKPTNEAITRTSPNHNNNNSVDGMCDEVFASDSQYGIMSRIVRNAVPTLIWTLKRDDIDFRLLQKDQIVNHYTSAWTFTTKTGLCTHLKNIVAFDTKNWLTFFPRCYRLCCDEEKDDFIDDYRLTTLQCIMKLVILRHKEWRDVEREQRALSEELQNNCYENCSEMVNDVPKKSSRYGSREKSKKYPVLLPGTVISLVFKKSYLYLDMKNNQDIEESYEVLDESIEDLHWHSIINYYNQIINQNAIITNAWRYVGECVSILKQMEPYCPQMKIDGYNNLWILKPGAKSRGRGIEIMSQLNDISNLVSGNVSQKENRWVIQKYIERPLLVYRTKFDIRQWFLVTDWNPLILWFYKDCYIRFCSQEFTLTKFDAQVHLSNNSVQKHFQNGIRSEMLPESNMWSSERFKEYLTKIGKELIWDEKIYPGMKSAIIAALRCCQNDLEYRKNSFELYGADFMLCEDLNPWLIEINSSPALGASTPVTEVLCRNVLEDTLKVILDRRENRNCDTGQFELAYRQPYVSIPSYMGCNLSVEGSPICPPTPPVPTVRPFNVNSTKPKVTMEPNEPKLKLETQSVTSERKEDTCSNVVVNNNAVAVKKNTETSADKATTSPPKQKIDCLKSETKPVSRLDGIIAKLNLGATTINKRKAVNCNHRRTTFSVAELLELTKQHNKQKTNDNIDNDNNNNNNNNNKDNTTNNKDNTGNKSDKILKQNNGYQGNVSKQTSKLAVTNNNNSTKSGTNCEEDVVDTDVKNYKTKTTTKTLAATCCINDNFVKANNNNNNHNVMMRSNSDAFATVTSTVNITNQHKSITNRTHISRHQKMNAKRNPRYNGTFELKNEKPKPPSPEPASCSGNSASTESLDEPICPQKASYDLRKTPTMSSLTDHRENLNKEKYQRQKRGWSTGVAVTSGGGYKWYKQYGLLDAEDITGIKQVNNRPPPFLLNQHKTNETSTHGFRNKSTQHSQKDHIVRK